MREKVEAESLIKNYIEGINKNEAAAELLRLYGKMVYSTIANITYPLPHNEIDDIYQEVWLKTFNKLHQLSDRAGFGGWIKKIATHTAIDYIKKIKTITIPIDDYQPDPVINLEATILNQERIQELREAINNIPEYYSQVIKLFYWCDMDYKSIAEALNIPIGTVMSRLNKGKQKLNKILRAGGGEDEENEYGRYDKGSKA